MPSDEVIYSCPFVPPGLVRAYGLRPRRLIPDVPSAAASRAGVCPFAHDFTQAALSLPAAGIVFTTLCDQMRRQAEVAAAGGTTPVFCLNVPRTWRDPACEAYYLAELRRLGRFLEGIGGRHPSEGELAAAIAAEAAGGFNGNSNSVPPQCGGLQQQQQGQQPQPQRPPAVRGASTATASARGAGGFDDDGNMVTQRRRDHATHAGAVPIAMVGGPIAAGNWLFDLLDELGLYVALDATETGLAGRPYAAGQLNLVSQADAGGQPGASDALAADTPESPAGSNYKSQITNYKSSDSLEALAAAYFAGIHHPSRFPADHLYDWLLPLLARSGARAIVLRYYAWCDPWHAQAHRLAQRSGLNVVEIDGRETPGRAKTRLQAIAEMVK